MDKKNFTLIGIGLFLVIGAFVYKTSLNDDKLPTNNINTSLKIGNGRDTSNSQLEAYELEEKDSIANARKGSGNILSDFGKFTSNGNANIPVIKKGRTDEEIIDSILNAQKIVYSKPKLRKPIKNKRKNSTNKFKKKKENFEEKRKREIDNIKESFNHIKGLDTPKPKPILQTDNIILARVNGEHSIKNKTRVKLILKKEAIINGTIFKNNTRFFGFATFGEHRLFIKVNHINNIKVDLQVYDANDGGLGLYTKANIKSAAAHEIADDIDVKGVPVAGTIKKIFKKNKSVQKVGIGNRTEIILKK